MKPLKAKAKNKKNNAKFTTKDNVNVPDPDFTNLRKPVDISVSSLCQVNKLLENGSDEVKAVLAYECDIIYECRICHSLYRSLVNFISHKRVYCKEKFNVTINKNLSCDYELVFGKDSLAFVEAQEQTVFKNSNSNDRILRSHTPREENRKDLTAVIDMLQKKQQKCNTEKQTNSAVPNGTGIGRMDKVQLCFESVDTNKSAVYQTSLDSMDVDSASESMKTQLLEIENMKRNERAVSDIIELDRQLRTNSHSEKSDSPLQVYGSDEESKTIVDSASTKNLICSICNAIFATKKTLAAHVKTLHTTHRMCYPCPCCSSVFANTWSVYRHLFKVHRKSNEQVRKLRSQIQEKAFRKQTTTTEDLEKETPFSNNSSSNLLRVNETQEWMEHLESDSELQRCGGCGKRFDRKAALSSHSQYCQRRIAACSVSNVNNKIKKSNKAQEELRIHNNVQNADDVAAVMTTGKTISEGSSVVPEVNRANEISIRVQAVSTLSKADWDKIDSGQPLSSDLNEIDMISISANTEPTSNATTDPTDKRSNWSPSSDFSDTPEIIFTKLDRSTAISLDKFILAHPEGPSIPLNGGSKRRKLSSGRRINPTMERTEKASIEPAMKMNSRLSVNSLSKSTEIRNDQPVGTEDKIVTVTKVKSTVNRNDQSVVIEDKIATIANLRKLQCVPCKRKFTSMTNLRRHIAIHIGWNRYCCKLCNFKCFVKCDCVAHCNKMHNAQNNRTLIAQMVMEIPPAQHMSNQDAGTDIANVGKTVPEWDKQQKPLSGVQEQTSTPAIVVSETENEKPNTTTEMENSNKSVTRVVDTVPEERPAIAENVDQDKMLEPENNYERINNTAEECTSTETDQDCAISANTNSQLGRLDSDADLRRMVMEVIFGSADVIPEKSTKEECTNSDNNNVSMEKKPSESGENFIISSGSEDSKESSVSSVQDELKPQRPIRNRIKPVNKDFIYDLKEVAFRKESVTLKATTLATHKMLMKKPYVRLQANECNINFRDNNPLKDRKSTDSVPLLASCDSDGIENGCDVSNPNLKSSFNLSQINLVQKPGFAIQKGK